jgi:hypothetical protein
MEGYGILIIIAFVLLTIAIVTSTCTNWSFIPGKEGFQNSSNKQFTPPNEIKVPIIGPGKQELTDRREPDGYTSVSDLPSAPITGLAETNALPFNDPVLEKSSFAQLNSLKMDMDGFASFEMPELENRSDPSIKLPLTRFKGDYQRVKDELRVVAQNPGVDPQLTIDDINDMAANLRFLQRTYRVYSDNQMVPPPKAKLSSVGLTNSVEGFASNDDSNTPITQDELSELSLKLATEITRLQASGAQETNAVIQARVNIFSKLRQQVDDMLNKIKNGTMDAKSIPIMKSDYKNFLPVLGKSSSGIGKLISDTGGGSLSSLFDSYEKGDVNGQKIAEELFDKYAKDLIKGTSWSVKYTSPYEVEKSKADAAMYGSMNAVVSNALLNPAMFSGSLGSKGEFDETIRQLDIANFTDTPRMGENNGNGTRPPTKVHETGAFDWKERAESITENIRKMGLNPSDFGALPRGTQVSSDFSWRGQAKMMCSRLATHSDPGVPEQVGCPPVSWKGWRA